MLAQERDVWTFYVPPKTSKKTFLQIEKAQKKKKKKKKPNINNFFHDHGVVNVALKWNFVSFWHYHGVVNEVENYKNIFFLKPRVVNVVAKWTVNGVPHDIQIFFPYDHTKNHT